LAHALAQPHAAETAHPVRVVGVPSERLAGPTVRAHGVLTAADRGRLRVVLIGFEHRLVTR
jgi:hypothetical protein